MSDVTFRGDFPVELVDYMGGDDRICEAARTSTLGDKALDSKESQGLIRFLMKNRHGSPFEHGVLQWLITAPIFVWREFHRHRIASYNEESARYRQLKPVFYLPPPERPLSQVGKPGAYDMVPGTKEQYNNLCSNIKTQSRAAYTAYELMLEEGIAREAARMVLPVNIYSTCIVTMNVRALMNFLSLRVDDPHAAYPSKPQWEINQVADEMENYFRHQFPHTYLAFQEGGRVAP